MMMSRVMMMMINEDSVRLFDKSMTCVQTDDLEAPICEHVSHILDIGDPKHRF